MLAKSQFLLGSVRRKEADEDIHCTELLMYISEGSLSYSQGYYISVI